MTTEPTINKPNGSITPVIKPNAGDHFEPHILDIEKWLLSHSANTRRTYTIAIKKYLVYCERINKTISLCSASDIELFISSLTGSTASKRLTLNSVRSLYKYLCRPGESLEHNLNPCIHLNITLSSTSSSHAQALTDDQAHILINQASVNSKDRLIVSMLLILGLRVSELCQAKQSDLDSCTLTILGKGNKSRTVQLPPAICALMDQIQADQKYSTDLEVYIEQDSPLLTNPRNGFYTPRQIQRVLDRLCRNSGQPKITPHQLRATFITKSVTLGQDVDLVRRMAGHSSLETTQGYITRANYDLEAQSASQTLASIFM